MKDDPQVQSDGITVWVHDAHDGSCIGRFGRMGIDIHRPVSEQAEHGQCLLCTHGSTGPDHWRRFVAAMQDIYDVKVSERHRPRHLAQIKQENIMTQMLTYVVEGHHHVVPGRILSVHFSARAADEAAFDLVKGIAQNAQDVPPAPADAGEWRRYLADVQRTIAAFATDLHGDEDEDTLAEIAECDVSISVVEVPAPRVVVSVQGGLVQGGCSDVPVDFYVIDYDVEGASESSIIDIPQDEGKTSEGTMNGHDLKIDPDWIDAVVDAYDAHDPDQPEEAYEETAAA